MKGIFLSDHRLTILNIWVPLIFSKCMKAFCSLINMMKYQITHAWTYLLLALLFQSLAICLKNICKLKSRVQKNETNKKTPQFIVTADPSCKGADGTHPYAIGKWETTHHLSYQESIRCSNKRENTVFLKAILCSRKLQQNFYKLNSSCYLLFSDGIILLSTNSSMNVNWIHPRLTSVSIESWPTMWDLLRKMLKCSKELQEELI